MSAPEERVVKLVFASVEEWSAFTSVDEVERFQVGTVWVVRVKQYVVEEIVHVERYARLDGHTVTLSGPRKGKPYLAFLEGGTPQLAMELGYDGDGRHSRFVKEVPPGAIDEVWDQVEVQWRLGVGRI